MIGIGKIILLSALCGLLAACAEKRLPGSKNVRVLDDPAMAENCRHFASSLIQNKNPLLDEEEQKRRLLIKAKNLAYELRADTVAPMPGALKDRQRFRFYLCGGSPHDNG